MVIVNFSFFHTVVCTYLVQCQNSKLLQSFQTRFFRGLFILGHLYWFNHTFRETTFPKNLEKIIGESHSCLSGLPKKMLRYQKVAQLQNCGTLLPLCWMPQKYTTSKKFLKNMVLLPCVCRLITRSLILCKYSVPNSYIPCKIKKLNSTSY